MRRRMTGVGMRGRMTGVEIITSSDTSEFCFFTVYHDMGDYPFRTSPPTGTLPVLRIVIEFSLTPSYSPWPLSCPRSLASSAPAMRAFPNGSCSPALAKIEHEHEHGNPQPVQVEAEVFLLRAQLPFSRQRNSASEIGAVRPGDIAGFGFVAAFGGFAGFKLKTRR